MQNIHKFAASAAFVFTLGVSPAAFSESTGQYIDDVTLTTKVKAALLADTQVKASGISVQTNQGTVELDGTVNTADDESQAVKGRQQCERRQSRKRQHRGAWSTKLK